MSQKLSILEAVSSPEKLPVYGSFETGDVDSFSTDQNFYIQSRTSLARIVYNGSDTFCYTGGYFSDQLWKLYYTPKFGKPYYLIENVDHRYNYLCYNGSNVEVCDIKDNDDRLWKIEYAGNGYYRFVHKTYDAKLFLQESGSFGAYYGPDHGDQLWHLVPEKCPVVMLYAMQYGGRLVGYSDPIVDRGNVYSDQHWRIIPVEMEKDMPPQFFYLQNYANGLKLFHNSVGKFGAYEGNNHPDQQWEVRASGATFQFINRMSKGKIVAQSGGKVGCYVGQDHPDQSWMLMAPNMKQLSIKSWSTEATLSLNGSAVWSLLPDLNGGYYLQALGDGGRIYYDGNVFNSYVGAVYQDQVWNIISTLLTESNVFEIVNTKFRAKMYSSDSSSVTVRLDPVSDAKKAKEQFYFSWANATGATYNEDLIDEITDNNMFWLDSDTASVTSDSVVDTSYARSGGSNSDDEDFYGFQGIEDEAEYAYRVCRPDEDISEAIVCNDPNSSRSVSQHVSSGTRIPSHFISTTVEQSIALLWAFYNMQTVTRPRRREPLRIIRIRLNDVRALPDIMNGCVNLNNINIRDHFIQGATARNFARSSRELLFQYRIPSSCYNIVVDPERPRQPPRKRPRNSYAEILELVKNIDL